MPWDFLAWACVGFAFAPTPPFRYAEDWIGKREKCQVGYHKLRVVCRYLHAVPAAEMIGVGTLLGQGL
jgi:hypothetical protein